MKHGSVGIDIFWAITEMLHEQGGYIPFVECERIAFELRTDCDIVADVLRNSNLFIIDGDNFYSERVLENLKIREDKSLGAKKSALSRWNKINSPDIQPVNANALQPQSEGNAIKGKEIKLKEKKSSNIEDRKNEFLLKCKNFESEYGLKMITKFFEYWTEQNLTGTKMKFEIEKTFELSKRLSRWNSNNFDSKPINNGKSTESFENGEHTKPGFVLGGENDKW